ncbi:MAG: thioredoxin domain-containing protein [Planctomycetes bacterium]|nr:thioredoxin domain-containing protein [Planctomycetota bacterium]
MTAIDAATSPSATTAGTPHEQGAKRAALVILAFAGLAISLILTAMSNSAGNGSLVSSLCSPSARVNCEHVLASDAARIGPISSALLGVAYFAALLTWFVAVGLPNHKGRKWFLLPLAVVILGNLASLRFVYLMAAVLPVWCTWCVAAHVANALILLVMVFARPRAGRGEAGDALTFPSTVRAGIAAGSATSLALVILLAGIAIHHQVNSFRFQAEYLKLANDVDYIVWKHRTAPNIEFSVRPTDTVVGTEDAAHTLVVFSDFECAACAEFHRNAQSLVQSFPGVRVVFRQFPMCGDCNPSVKQSFHPHACDAAMAAEAFAERTSDSRLRMQYMSRLFDSRARFAGKPYAALASEVAKMDQSAFKQAMQSDIVKRRVAEDVELGNRIGLEGTPAMFLDGRRLPTWRIVTPESKPDVPGTKKLWSALLK